MGNDGLFDSAKNLWQAWNIRAIILLSLSMQTILILLGPLRNRTSNTLITILIWSAYLLADWSPKFGVGLITQSKVSAGGADGSGSVNNQFVALWAQFLLLHLGGSDTITAFSLEDNQLWVRQLFGATVQAVAAGYIFFQTLPGGNQLVIPAIFVFIAGVIKCFERIGAAYLASEKVVRKMIEEELPDDSAALKEESENKDDVELARLYSKLFLGIMFDLIIHFDFNLEHFVQDSSIIALKNMEVELNYIYEFFHTKINFVLRFKKKEWKNFVLSKSGMILRFTSFCSVVVALSVFYSEANSSNDAFEVGVTYTLFWATIALELLSIGFILHSRADKTKQASLKTRPLLWRRWSCSISGFSWMTYFAKAIPLHQLARCDRSEASASDIIFARIIGLFGLGNIVDDIRIRTRISHKPLPEELWNLIFQQIKKKADHVKKQTRPSDDLLDKIFQNDTANEVLPLGLVKQTLRDLVRRLIGSNENIFPLGLVKQKLDDLIEQHLHQSDSDLERSAAKAAAKREINSSRGDWILRQRLQPESAHRLDEQTVKSIKKPTQSPPGKPRYRFDQDVLIWHAATELLYYTDDHQDLDRDFSKLLSDYMLYLLVSKPEMLNTVEIVARSDLKISVPELLSVKLSSNPSELCESILNGSSGYGMTGKLISFAHGRDLANVLKSLDRKWELIREVWIDMLAYGATHSRGRTHAQQLCNGGELITFVWLLTLHFGLVENKPQD